jgi:hypothetical protein
MPDATTTNRGYPYPNGKDFIPNGPAEMEAIVNALDEENRGEIDHLQAGVTLSTDWSFAAAMESTSECKLESVATTGGVCWLPLTAIGLVRSFTTAAKIQKLKPSSLPGTGKYGYRRGNAEIRRRTRPSHHRRQRTHPQHRDPEHRGRLQHRLAGRRAAMVYRGQCHKNEGRRQNQRRLGTGRFEAHRRLKPSLWLVEV